MGKKQTPQFVKAIVGTLEDRRWSFIVIGLVFLVTAISIALGAPSFSSHTRNTFPPYEGTRTYKEVSAFKQYFPSYLTDDVEVIYIKNMNGTAVQTPDAKAMCAKLQSEFAALKDPALIRTTSLYNYIGTDLALLSLSYMNSDGSAMIFAITLDTTLPTGNVVSHSIAFAKALNATYGPLGYSVIATGKLTTIKIAKVTTGKGFAIANGSGLPFIALIFWWQTGSGRMLWAPMLALGVSLMCSWGVGVGLSTSVLLPSYLPDIVLFLCLALSIDYSFFLITRFQEERGNGKSVPDAVGCMLWHSGRIIGVSGSILVVTWFALSFFPVFGLQGVGYGAALTVAICILSNMLLTPALLLAFPGFFGRAPRSLRDSSCCCCCFRDRKALLRRQRMQEQGALPSSHNSGSLVAASGELSGAATAQQEEEVEVSEADAAYPRPARSCYTALAEWTTTLPGSLLVPLFVYGLFALGVATQLPHLSLSIGATFNFGKSAAATAFGAVEKDFRSGVFQTPFAVLGVYTPPPGANVSTSASLPAVFNPTFFAASCSLAQRIVSNASAVVMPSVAGIFARPTFSTTPRVVDCLSESSAQNTFLHPGSSPFGGLYAHSVDTLARNGSAVFTFQPDFNPFSEEVAPFIATVRDAIDSANAQFGASGVQFWLYHPMCSEVDSRALVEARFPLVTSLMLLFVFALVALRFRAALVPLKLLLTVAVPILFVFSLAVAVYQGGALDWTGIHAFKSTGSGISWLLPCATVYLLIGLALDYDLFLFSRVYEMRSSGLFGTREAIIRAVEITGPVISGAGVIMALAFAGMLVNTNAFLNVFGFVMVTGVLLDTFVVRTVLVPSVLSMVDWLNWWPTAMPAVGDSAKDDKQAPLLQA